MREVIVFSKNTSTT